MEEYTLKNELANQKTKAKRLCSACQEQININDPYVSAMCVKGQSQKKWSMCFRCAKEHGNLKEGEVVLTLDLKGSPIDRFEKFLEKMVDVFKDGYDIKWLNDFRKAKMNGDYKNIK